MKCLSCNHESIDGARFCTRCGSPLSTGNREQKRVDETMHLPTPLPASQPPTLLKAERDAAAPAEVVILEVKQGGFVPWSIVIYPNWVRIEKRGDSMNIPLKSVIGVQFQPQIGRHQGYLNIYCSNTGRITTLAEAETRLSAVVVSKRHTADAQKIKKTIEGRVLELNPATQLAADTPMRVLDENTRVLAHQNINANEDVLFCLVGGSHQSLVGLPTRVLVIKSGAVAGATFGSKVTNFHYSDLTGVEIRTGRLMGAIELSSPSFQGSNDSDSAYRAPNCIPIATASLKSPPVQSVLALLREKIAEARRPMGAPIPIQQSVGDVASSLEKLVTLHNAGALTDDEFQKAKLQILG